MAEGADHEQKRADAVNDIGNLHHAAGLVVVGKIEDEARQADDNAQESHTSPEPHLLAGIEEVRWNVFSRSHPAALFQPD